MTTRRVRLTCFTVVLFLFSAFPAFASGVRMVRLSLVQGDVQIDRNSGEGWEQAIINMPVIGGARIYAAENSKAELEFEDGSSIRLAGPSQISVMELSSTPDGSPVNAIQVDSGEIYVNARLHDHGNFRISAYSGESFAISKPSHLRFTVKEQTASLAMTDGEAIAQSASDHATIRSGETYNYILGQPASAVRLASVPAEADDSWNQQRESYNDQNASAGAQYSGSEDANAPGVADLGAYGSYSDVPGYGESWQPEGVGPDWDPFDNGAWCYYPDWGWTFVSAYPWGWAPFYYGNWFYRSGHGWWWHPGPRQGPGNGFHPRPVLSGAPHGFSEPHPPAGSAHGTVAVAGSHLRVGPIGVTHATAAVSGGFAGASRTAASTTARADLPAASRAASAGATSSLVHAPAGSNSHALSISGRKGSYTLSGSSPGRNGFEVRRPPAGGAAPHSYAYSGSSAPRIYNVPAAPSWRASSAPSVSYAPHVSSGVGAVYHGASGVSGGGFHGGGVVGGAHGGGGHR